MSSLVVWAWLRSSLNPWDKISDLCEELPRRSYTSLVVRAISEKNLSRGIGAGRLDPRIVTQSEQRTPLVHGPECLLLAGLNGVAYVRECDPSERQLPVRLPSWSPYGRDGSRH